MSSFINFNNRESGLESKYSAEVIKTALLKSETKSSIKAETLTRNIKEPVSLNEALVFFTDKLGAIKQLNQSIVEINEGRVKQFEMDYTSMVKDIKKGYGWIDPDYVAQTWDNSSDSIDFELVRDEIFDRLIAAGLLAHADDNNPEKAGKKIKSAKELYAFENVEVNEARSISKIQKDWSETTTKMSQKVIDWKEAEGDRKIELLDELKALTKRKSELEKELDTAVAGKDKDVQLAISEDHSDNPNDEYEVRPCDEEGTPFAVWEGDVRVKCFATEEEAQAFADKQNKEQGLDSTTNEAFSRMSNDAIGNELYAATQALTTYYDWLKAGNDAGKGKSIDHIISLLKKCKSSIKRFDNKEETIGTEYEAPAMESVVTEAKGFKNTKDFEDFLEEIDGMGEAQIKKIMGKDYIDTPGFYQDEKENYDNDIIEFMISNMGSKEFEKLESWWENNVAESVVNESEAENILNDLLDERGGDMGELHGMEMEDALDTVEAYGHKGSKAKKIAQELHSLCNESTVTEANQDALKRMKEIVDIRSKMISDYMKKHPTVWDTETTFSASDTKKFRELENEYKELEKEITNESVVTEAKFVKDFNRDVLDAKTKEEVLELYPNAEFFIGKSDHFFGELDGNLFFKAYYTKAQEEFEIKSVYSEKGSNYVHLYNESVVTENYEVIYSDGVSAIKKFRNEKQALDFMKKTIASNKKLRDIAVYKPGMHSTTQTELVVSFWGDGSYLDNVSKRDEDLAAKKLEEGNAFGAARAEAIAKGEKEFKVDGETFKVEDVDTEDKENAEEFVEESKITLDSLVEMFTEKETVTEDLRSDVKKFIKQNNKELDELADQDQWDLMYQKLYDEFEVEADSTRGKDLLKTFQFVY